MTGKRWPVTDNMHAPLAAVLLLAPLPALAGAAAFTNSVGMTLVPVPAGDFVMGQDGPAADYRMTRHPERFDDADWDEAPAHRVVLSRPFHLAATETTLGQYRAFDPDFRAGEGRDDDALSGVSWEQASAFCAWLAAREGRPYRLPTEAEWEYACRAGGATLFSGGDALPDGFQPWPADAGHRDRYFTNGLPPVYRAGGRADLRVARTPANAWGLFDLHGNVAEWCADWYGPYEAGGQVDPAGRSTGDFRVIRGGSHSCFVRLLRSANRAAWLPSARSDRVGFRVALGDPPAGERLPPPPPPLNRRDVGRAAANREARDGSQPFFAGPQPFVIIGPGQAGPLFSAHNHSPALAECPNGDLLAVWYSCVDEAGAELCNAASRLRAGATAWEPASPFWDGADVNDHAPKLWWDGGTTLYHFARGREENIVRTSVDSGASWSPARLIQPVGEFGNAPLRLRDGTLVLGNDARQVSLVYSRDGGATWAWNEVEKGAGDVRPGGRGPRYPGIHAPLAELGDGRILAFSRNDKVEDQARFDFRTPASWSADLGRTWTYAATEFPAISSVQRAALIRLREGPLLLCSFTDQWRDWKKRRGMTFRSAAGEFTGYGLFAALSLDDGATWPLRRLLTPGGPAREVNGIDALMFTLDDARAEPCGYLAAIQARDGRVHLLTSRNHYAFNLAWLRGGDNKR